MPSGQQIRGQQSASVLQVCTSNSNSPSGVAGHSLGITPNNAVIRYIVHIMQFFITNYTEIVRTKKVFRNNTYHLKIFVFVSI